MRGLRWQRLSLEIPYDVLTMKPTRTPKTKPSPARQKPKIPKGWRRLRVGANRPKDYKWFYGCYFEHGYDVLIGTPITSQDNQQSGPYIGKIKARAALSSIGLDAKGGK